VGTLLDLELLYDNEEIAPGLVRTSSPWGVTVQGVVEYLLDNPTVHVDDVLRQMLISSTYPRGTQRDYANVSAFMWTTQEVLRNVASRRISAMLPVYHLDDRNDRTRVQVENSVAAMMGTRPTAGTGADIPDVPIHLLVVDLIDTPDDRADDDAAP